MKNRKRTLKIGLATLVVVASIIMLSSCASLLAGMLGITVEPPESSDSSLLFVELIAYTWDQEGTRSDDLPEINFKSGFFPIVVDEYGNEIAFSHMEGMTEAGITFYHENLSAGTYTLKGFRYLWMTDYNFLYSPIKDLQFDGQRDDEFIEVQVFNLPTPIEIEVKPGTVHSLGSYKVYYELREYEYMQNPDMVVLDDEMKISQLQYEEINPDDTHLLNLMKDWTYEAWVLWNNRNPLN